MPKILSGINIIIILSLCAAQIIDCNKNLNKIFFVLFGGYGGPIQYGCGYIGGVGAQVTVDGAL